MSSKVSQFWQYILSNMLIKLCNNIQYQAILKLKFTKSKTITFCVLINNIQYNKYTAQTEKKIR